MRKKDGFLKLLGLCLLAGVLVAGLLFPIAGGFGVMSNQASATVENTSTELANVPPPLVTTVTDSKGERIASLYRQYRIPTASDQISDAMKWALISVEDRRFYQHDGVDWQGTARAAISNSQGGDTQGASTLTQQYVKNYLINSVYWNDQDPEHRLGRQKAQEQSLARKLKEARIAIELETKMSKDEILTGYLNVVEFSQRVFGVGAAARAYFGVEAKDLNTTQSALLAGMVNNPSSLDPWNHPEKAKEKRNQVLDRMVGNRKLDADDAEELKDEPLGVLPGGPNKPASNCVGAGKGDGFFCQYVLDYLTENGMDLDDIFTGGYTIKTTLDQDMSKEAKDSLEKQIPKENSDVAGTLSLVRPGKNKHEVTALAANRDYGPDAEQNQTEWGLPSEVSNTQGAGSTYKIFTAAAAMEEGVAGIYDSIPAPGSYTSQVFYGGADRCPMADNGSRRYCVGNAEDASFDGGRLTLQQALAQSPNTSFVYLEEKAGMKSVVNMASKLGMRKTMQTNTVGHQPDPDGASTEVSQTQTEFFGPTDNSPGNGSFTLGPAALSGLELSNVGATIMSGGRWCPPTPIREITDRDGNEVEVEEEPCEQAVPKGLADTLAVGMGKDHTDGTAQQAADQADWGDQPMIGKTGTSQSNASATFLGATPHLSGGAMIFQPDRNKGALCDGGTGQPYICGEGTMWGGRAPARAWFGAMKPIHDDLDRKGLPSATSKYERQ